MDISRAKAAENGEITTNYTDTDTDWENTVKRTKLEYKSIKNLSVAEKAILRKKLNREAAARCRKKKDDLIKHMSDIINNIDFLNFQKDARVACNDIKQIKQDARVACNDIKQIKEDARVASNDIQKMKNDARVACNDIKQIKEDDRVASNDIQKMKNDARVACNDIIQIKQDVSNIKLIQHNISSNITPNTITHNFSSDSLNMNNYTTWLT